MSSSHFIASMRICIKRGHGCYCAHAHETPLSKPSGSATGSYVLNQLDTSTNGIYSCRNPRAPSSALAALGTLQPGALVFLQAVDPYLTIIYNAKSIMSMIILYTSTFFQLLTSSFSCIICEGHQIICLPSWCLD